MKQWRTIMRESLLEAIKLAYDDPNAAYPLAGVLTIEGPEDRAIEPVLDMSAEVPDLTHTIFSYGSYEQAVASLDALFLLMDIGLCSYDPWDYLKQGVVLPGVQGYYNLLADWGSGSDRSVVSAWVPNSWLIEPGGVMQRFDVDLSHLFDEEE